MRDKSKESKRAERLSDFINGNNRKSSRWKERNAKTRKIEDVKKIHARVGKML